MLRVATVLGVAIGAHIVVLGIRAFGRRLLRSRWRSETKVHTMTSFGSSLLIFGIYFGAAGFVFTELGVSLTTYFASASVIGLAVSFGSQGVVQDVITGITLVTSDLLDVGDMVELAGQVGIVESISMRFTVLVNFTGGRVSVPNRSIMNVVNYADGYTRAYIDVRLPEDPATHDDAEQRFARIAESAYEQYPGILLRAPTVEGRHEMRGAHSYVRIKFRIWPGQGAVLETAVKPAIAQSMRQIDSGYLDWMVVVHYRAESLGGDPQKRLPRPFALGS